VTGLSNGQICVLYSPTSSLNGAKLPLSKGPPRKVTIEDMSDALAQPAIITPHALPMFREGEIVRGTGKRKTREGEVGPKEEQATRVARHRSRQGRKGWGECDATRCAKLGEGHNKRGGRTWLFLSLPSVVERSADYRPPPRSWSVLWRLRSGLTLVLAVPFSCRVFLLPLLSTVATRGVAATRKERRGEPAVDSR
jgi:hypothetical protein